MTNSVRRRGRLGVAALVGLGLMAAPLAVTPALASTDGTGVVINEVYTKGGSQGAPFNKKFVELYNPGDAAVDLSGWSLQYRSAINDVINAVAPLSGTVAADGHFLLQINGNGPTGAALPTPDLDLGSALNPSGTTGTIVLAKTTSAVTFGTGSVTGQSDIADLIGFGTSNAFEGALKPVDGPNGTPNSLTRTNFADTDNNAADFVSTTAITPENAASDGGSGEPTDEPTGEPTDAPGDVITIAEIQGTEDVSAKNGQTVTTRGLVTAAYPTGGFDGYYIQTPGTGGALDVTTHTASDAVFVYSPSTVSQIAVGDYLELTGAVSEFNGLTELTVSSAAGLEKLDASTVTPVAPATVSYPTDPAKRESLEGMLLAPQGSFTVSDNYDTNFYGEIGLAADTTPLYNPTVKGAVGSAEYQAALARNAAIGVILDDGASTNFNNTANKSKPLPYLSTTDPVRIGASVTFTKPVVLDYRNNAWKFQPTTELTPADAATVQPATFENTRQDQPAEVGGDIRLATFNVLNYFSTTGDDIPGCTFYNDREGNHIAVSGGCDARGAANEENFLRQQSKIVDAINGLGADVVSLEEIENSLTFGKGRDDALANIVAALNADLGSEAWDYVRSPAVLPADEDVIRTAFIYKTASIETVGSAKILTDSPAFTNAREPQAQQFRVIGSGDTFVVVANHLKSKGDSEPPATGDNEDGPQGAFNGDRTRQATALVDFADAFANEAGTDKVFLVGDFNSYAKEDPIAIVEGAGYIDQGAKSGKETYAFDGAIGSLDYVFASPSADATVTGTDVWNINSVESVALEYSRYNYNALNLYAAGPFRSSDHDPIVVGLQTEDPNAPVELNLLNINDFHGRIDESTVKFAGTVEQLRAAAGEENTLFLSAGDNIGASVFASSSQQDQPTIEVLNALGLQASAAGNHEFDRGFSDLDGRVSDEADFSYLGANVYLKGTQTPALQEYKTFEVDGLTVAVIGVVTKETPTLVSPDGVGTLEFGDPVDAINRVATQLSDGDEANGEADVIVAEYHEGAGAGTPDGATVEQEIAAGGAFATIATQTSPDVDAIFTGHTHKQYAWEGPIPGVTGQTRPIVQTGNYGENIGQITLTVDPATGDVIAHTARNVARTADADEALAEAYPRVRDVKGIVDLALERADEIGSQPVGSVSKDITTAFTGGAYAGGFYTGGARDDRGSESTLGNLVADSLVASLGTDERGGAQIGVANPGGLRDELLYGSDGTVTFAEADAVLPFVNNLWTTTLTGAQFKQVLEEQWQRDATGTTPSRSFLALGLSDNVNYTYDETRERDDRITSITIDNQPIDLEASYRVGSFNFLLQGGDNFWTFAEGTDTRDSGLVDRDAWIQYIGDNSPLSPSFDRRGVAVNGIPTESVQTGSQVSVDVSKLNLTSLGSPVNTELTITWPGSDAVFAPVTVSAEGSARVTVTVPADAAGSAGFALTATESGTVVRIPLTVVAGPGSGSGEPQEQPVPADEPAVTPELENQVTIPAGEYKAGDSVVVTVGAEHIGEWVSVWLRSAPVSLGWHQVSAEGTVTVALPADVPVGEHRLVVQAADGSVIGWTAITIVADSDSTSPTSDSAGAGHGPGLASTGANVVPWIVGGGILLLLGAVALILGMRRRQAGGVQSE